MEVSQGNTRRTADQKAPDGGWGWVVCTACFFCHVITDGIFYSFGIIFLEFLDYFGTSKGETAVVSSLATGLCFLIGPVVAALTNKFGCRTVAVAGSLLTAGSFVISVFATSVQYLYISLGFISGVGYGMVYLPSIVCVSQYFEARRALATGIGVSGSGIGTFIFSPLTSILIQNYGWQGTILIQAGLILNCLPCGLVYRPLNVRSNSSDTELGNVTSGNENFDSGLMHGRNEENSDCNGDACADSRPCNGQDSNLEARKIMEPLLSNSDDATTTVSVTFNQKNTGFAVLRKRLQSLKKSFDVSIFCNVTFCMFVVSTFLYSLGYYIPFVYLPDMAMELGLDEFKASFLLSAIGITNTIGRVVFGFLSDMKWVNRMVLYATALVICGVGTSIGPLLKSYELLLVYSIVFGTFSGVTISLASVILTDVVGAHRIADAFGVNNFFAGIASFAGPPLAGWLYDVSSSYLLSYALAGGSIFLSGALLYCVPCLTHLMKRS